jgi:gamma-glutamyltranspeptidase/glutathione hydrolase
MLIAPLLSASDSSNHLVVSPGKQAIASAHPFATQAGLEILNAGGNAFDAAITVASVLAVVEPYSSGMGGGGFWLLHQAKDQRSVFLDGREKAPSAAHSAMYQDKSGNVVRSHSINGPLAAGIPGQPAALVHLAEKYGKLPLKQTLSPAIHYAKYGFPVDKVYLKLASFRLKAMQADVMTRQTFLGEDGNLPKLGALIKQPELAVTLERIAKAGNAGFYQGDTAQALVKNMAAYAKTDQNLPNGIWSLKDLASYQVIEREPITFKFGDYSFTSAPPPSAGGTALAQMFGMLDALEYQPNPDSESVHTLVETMRRAYRDRAEYLGDSDFVDIPDKLYASSYHQSLAKSISQDKATDSLSLPPVLPPAQGTHTTHYSILDGQGNRVSATLSVNLPFGSAYTDPDTGLLLNNEMDDFSSQPGVPNAYGLVASSANSIQPGKRPLSSMTPTFIESEETIAILGTPGGSRIITMVYLAALEHLKGKAVEDWVSLRRFHHQYLPDVIQHEPEAFSDIEKQSLEALGHKFKSVGRQYGNMHVILWNKAKDQVTAASDPRGIGQALVVDVE